MGLATRSSIPARVITGIAYNKAIDPSFIVPELQISAGTINMLGVLELYSSPSVLNSSGVEGVRVMVADVSLRTPFAVTFSPLKKYRVELAKLSA